MLPLKTNQTKKKLLDEIKKLDQFIQILNKVQKLKSKKYENRTRI